MRVNSDNVEDYQNAVETCKLGGPDDLKLFLLEHYYVIAVRRPSEVRNYLRYELISIYSREEDWDWDYEIPRSFVF